MSNTIIHCAVCDKPFDCALIHYKQEDYATDNCMDCLHSNPLYKTLIGGETVMLSSGIQQLKENIEESAYWPYKEFNKAECEAMDADIQAIYGIEGNTLDEVQSSANERCASLQRLFEKGVTMGALETDPEFRVWPTTFSLEITQVKLEDVLLGEHHESL